MDWPGMESESNDLAPGLILGDVGIQVPDDTEVRTDVCCFVRVRRLPEPPEASDGAEVETLRLKPLPGSPDGADCLFILRHAQLDRWQEDAFTGEFRTRQPACARSYFANGGVTLHLLDLDFFVPSFDPMALGDGVDVMQVAEDREVTAIRAFYAWAMDRIEDYNGGEINQLVLPEVWTTQVHLVPQIWAEVAGFCRKTGNRFLVADSAPPLRILQDEEIKRARAEGVELTEEELSASFLVPWYREEKWSKREDIPVEVAMTIDALDETRGLLKRQEVTLSSLALYWPWIKSLKGLDLPPSAAVAGVYARSDGENGPYGAMKPPANESVRQLMDLTVHLDEGPQNLLRREGVNLLQTRVGQGIVVWGARTLCELDAWQFVNVRRLMGYIGRQIEVDNQWAVFENNDEGLRHRITRDAEYFLQDLFEKGALDGETPEEAYRVYCGEENNPQYVVDAGQIMVDIWVKPVQTNEFVHLKLTYGDAVVDE